MTWLLLPNQLLLERLGWTLAHSVWQCAVIGVALAMSLALVRQTRVRYGVSCAALALTLLASLATFILLQPGEIRSPQSAPISPVATPAVSPGAELPVLPSAPPVDSIALSPRDLLPWAAIAWLIGVIFVSIQHLVGWASIRSLRREAVPIHSESYCTSMDRLCKRLGIDHAVVLAQSTLVNVPSVIGWLKPLILLPCSAMTDLSPQYLEAILAHELAHVRRQDFVMNLIQTAIETLLFYHPAVWWISRQIRQEREHCCDDLAVSTIGNAKIYTESLMALESLRNGLPDLALAADGGSLLKRVRRLTKTEPARGPVIWPALGLVGLILIVAAYSQTSASQVQAQTQTPSPSSQPSVFISPENLQTVERTEDTLRKRMLDAQNRSLELEARQRKIVAELDDLRRSRSTTTRQNSEALQKELEVIQNQINSVEEESMQLRGELARLNQTIPSAYYISGARQSGRYMIGENGMSLGLAIRNAGGLAFWNGGPQPEPRYVVITHQIPIDGQLTMIIGLRDVLQRPTKPNDPMPIGPAYNTQISPGDVIMITAQDSLSLPPEGRYFVTGEVPRPGAYPWQNNMTLLQALIASGINPPDMPNYIVEMSHSGNPPVSFVVGDMIGGGGGAMMGIVPGMTITVKPAMIRDPSTRPASTP